MVMRQILDFFRRPVSPVRTIEDEFCGTLRWDEKYRAWVGELRLASGKTTNLTFAGAPTDDSIPEVTREIARRLITNEPSIHGRVAAAMSELYNGQWGGGEENIPPAEMARRINLTSIWFQDDDCGELHHEADDFLYTDHTICTPFDANGEIGESELAG